MVVQYRRDNSSDIYSKKNRDTLTPKTDSDYYFDLMKEIEHLPKRGKYLDIKQRINSLRIRWNKGPNIDQSLRIKYTKRFEKMIEAHLDSRKHLQNQDKQIQEIIFQQQQLIQKLEYTINTSNSNPLKNEQLELIQEKWNKITLISHPHIEQLTQRYKKITTKQKEELKTQRDYARENHNAILKASILDKVEQEISHASTNKNLDWNHVKSTIETLRKEFQSLHCSNSYKTSTLNHRLQYLTNLLEQKHREQDHEYLLSIEQLIEKKKKFIEQAKSLVNVKNLAIAKYKLNHYHMIWKQLPKLLSKEEKDLWIPFNEASQLFYQRLDNNRETYQQQQQQLKEDLLNTIPKLEILIKEQNWEEGHKYLSHYKDLYHSTYYMSNHKLAKLGLSFRSLYDKFYHIRRLNIKEQVEIQKAQLERKKQLLNDIEKLIQKNDLDAQAASQIETYRKEYEDIILPKYMIEDLLKQQNIIWNHIYKKQNSKNKQKQKLNLAYRGDKIKAQRLIRDINILKENMLNIRDTSGKHPYFKKIEEDIKKKQQQLKEIYINNN